MLRWATCACVCMFVYKYAGMYIYVCDCLVQMCVCVCGSQRSTSDVILQDIVHLVYETRYLIGLELIK